MAKHRADRINEEVMRELAGIIRELKDPRIPVMTSVVRVSVTPDLKYAKAHELEQTLLRYLHGVPLQQGETHATVVADVDTDGSGRQSVVFVVAAFKQGVFAREVKRIPVMEFVKNLNLSEILK